MVEAISSSGWVACGLLGVALVVMSGDFVGPGAHQTLALFACSDSILGSTFELGGSGMNHSMNASKQKGLDLVFMTLMAAYTALRFITPEQGALKGSHFRLEPAKAVNCLLSGLERVMNSILGSTQSAFLAQVRMMLPVMLASAFLNNTRARTYGRRYAMGWAHAQKVKPAT
eukprot:40864-Pelagomonas_calceolata.AAC.2